MNALAPRFHSRPIVLTAGGTGGHVFPAEALATELSERGFPLALVTDRRGEGYGGALGRLVTYRIPAGGLAGRGPVARLCALGSLGVGTLRAFALLSRLRPLAVVGFGGYASVPAMLAAAARGIPTVIHEQNAVLGRANRLLASRASRIATSHARVGHLAPSLASRVVLTGMPVRDAILARRDDPYPAIEEGGVVRILVLGGSQGAHVLSEVIPAAVIRLPEELRRRVEICQQCRAEDLEKVRAAYAGAAISATLETFFRDVPERLSGAHLVISRSGASTVAELTAMGRPAILVPYPHAIDDHQMANARAIAEAEAGWLIPQDAFSPETLAARLEELLTRPETLAGTAVRTRAAGTPDAAKRLADVVATVAETKTEVLS